MIYSECIIKLSINNIIKVEFLIHLYKRKMNKMFLFFGLIILLFSIVSCQTQKQANPVKSMFQFDTWAIGDRFQPAWNNTPHDTMTWKGQQQDLIISYKWFLYQKTFTINLQTSNLHISQNFTYSQLQIGYAYTPFFQMSQKGLFFKFQATQFFVALNICLFSVESTDLQGVQKFVRSQLGPKIVVIDQSGKASSLKYAVSEVKDQKNMLRSDYKESAHSQFKLDFGILKIIQLKKDSSTQIKGNQILVIQ